MQKDVKSRKRKDINTNIKINMGFGAEMAMALVGLRGIFVRPMMLRYAAEMAEVMGYAILRFVRGSPPLVLSCGLPYSSSFLYA